MNNNFKEVSMKMIFFLSSLISIISIFLICIFIFKGGIPFIKEYGLFDFLLGKQWKPSNSPALYGILPMILGSLYITLLALIIGVPIGILTSIYMVYFVSDSLYKFLKPAINLMAGIPSIIYGFFALTVIVPLNRNIFGDTGMSIFTASILLAIMILPTIISLSESSIRAVPKHYYEGSIAMGESKEKTIFRVIIPAAKSGILSAVILGLGRAIGETMAVILVAGNQARIPDGLHKGSRTLTTNIVMDMAYAAGTHREALIATAVILFIFILLINLIFVILKRREIN